jgi:hypothetical protein
LTYTVIAKPPDISYGVAALYRYNSCLFICHISVAKRVLQYPQDWADVRLHFNGNGNGKGNGNDHRMSNGQGKGNGNGNYSVVGLTDSYWASDTSAKCILVTGSLQECLGGCGV